MKNLLLKSIIISFTTLLIGCSKDDPAPDPVTPPVVVTPPVTTPSDALTVANVKDYLVDKNATSETVALFYNLKKLAKTKVAIGQQDAFSGVYKDVTGDSDIKKTTGFDPAILGSDFIFITDKNNNGQADNWFYQQELKTISEVKKAYAAGMINTFAWHIREPNKEDSFYAADMTTEQKATAFKSILPGGTNNAWYKLKLDKVASTISKMTGSKGELIPIIFRPFHEFDGSWFWWGASYCSTDDYKAAYKFTVEYLRDTKGLHNILYAFSPDNSYTTSANYLSRYPGDTYVDVLGMDNYGDLASGQGQAGVTKANNKLKMISDLAISKVKIAAMTETGWYIDSKNSPITGWFSDILYSTLTNNKIEISYVVFWGNSKDGYYVPTPTASNVQDFKDFTVKSKSTLLNTLPSIYLLPKS
jgi:mannan endo-1,4-beta-mannosidase